MVELKKEAVMELKERIVEARRLVRDLESELASLTHKSAGTKKRVAHG